MEVLAQLVQTADIADFASELERFEEVEEESNEFGWMDQVDVPLVSAIEQLESRPEPFDRESMFSRQSLMEVDDHIVI